MATVNAIPPVTSTVTAATTNATNATSTAAGVGSAVDRKTIAGNFDTFLQLLTTQLRNQNPLDPLDTNQFTQQLVSFAGVEQQIRQNQQLETLISIQKSAQATTALQFVGATVAIEGSTAPLVDGRATWTFSTPKPATATITIRGENGQTVYSNTMPMSAGTKAFEWDGRDSNGIKLPDGNYTVSITGKDASGQTVAIASEVEGRVESVDLTKTPPEMNVGGQSFTIDKIKRVVHPRA
jgi:flagellar basal-body rod modification protein FlgD